MPRRTSRFEWIMNDAELYVWWQSSGLTMTAFIKANKAEIDAMIAALVAR